MHMKIKEKKIVRNSLERIRCMQSDWIGKMFTVYLFMNRRQQECSDFILDEMNTVHTTYIKPHTIAELSDGAGHLKMSELNGMQF